jgi:hypothetical protein
MAVSAVYLYKCADILPVEISRNCIITGYAAEVSVGAILEVHLLAFSIKPS